MPVEYPDNDFTRMIARVAEGNRSGVLGGGLSSADPLPTVRSAELGSISESAQDDPLPLSAEERAELDARALELGIQDERLGTPDTSNANYATLEEAIAAGAPIMQPEEHHLAPSGVVRGPDRQSAREFLFPNTARTWKDRVVTVPKLPDFEKIEGIDLVTNRVIVDGMDFAITEFEAQEFRKFVIEKVRTEIMEALDKAVSTLASATTPEDGNGATASTEESGSEVQREHQGSGEEPTF